MKIQIDIEENRREINSEFKIYGSQEDLKAISDAILKAIAGGLVQGWVGVGMDDGKVFPNNGTNPLTPVVDWKSATEDIK